MLFNEAQVKEAAMWFDGTDWTEVSEALGEDCVLELLTEEEPLRNRVQAAMSDLVSNEDNPSTKTKATVLACRAYTLASAETAHSYCGPLWAGMLKIEHDYTFLSFFGQLFPRMWD